MIYSLADFSDSANFIKYPLNQKNLRELKIFLKFKPRKNENHKNFQ
jgi:hypothetical protein